MGENGRLKTDGDAREREREMQMQIGRQRKKSGLFIFSSVLELDKIIAEKLAHNQEENMLGIQEEQ